MQIKLFKKSQYFLTFSEHQLEKTAFSSRICSLYRTGLKSNWLKKYQKRKLWVRGWGLINLLITTLTYSCHTCTAENQYFPIILNTTHSSSELVTVMEALTLPQDFIVKSTIKVWNVFLVFAASNATPFKTFYL